ncbi:MAG: hypothetical protein Q8R02_23835 [Hyphomonadaceae bacterium]|nr:hypothetical protein [Hyphomonadaceae bacterium]
MKIRLTLKLTLGCAGLAILAAPAGFAQATLAASSEYSSGSYGEATDTTLVYVAVTAGYADDAWTFDATLPWVELDGPATFIGTDAPLGRGTATTRTPGEKVSGLADLALSLTRTFDLSADGATRLDLTGRVQLPTGDEEKGLSTGEARGSLGLDLSRDVGDWTLFVGGGWRFNGGAYQDGGFGSAGLAWTGTNGVSIGAAYDWSEASTVGVEAASEVSAWVSLPMGETARFQLYGVAGFSEGSPDQAIGARILFGA